MKRFAVALSAVVLASKLFAADANRFVALEDPSPFWPGPSSPRLVTPQWVGESGVDAVVILAIDDMREASKYETFLRPILDRLRRIDGRAPVSIMTNTVAVEDPQFQTWLKEGLSLEVHTLAHPCPGLGKMKLEEATQTVLGGADLLAKIPNNAPVAFRMPCCDSMNSLSPRLFHEVFGKASREGRLLAVDSSVFTRPPGERYARYFPETLRAPMKRALGDYAGFIEDYPFPYVVAGRAWEFPCAVPSDWEAFNVLGPKSPVMLEDWKAHLDRIVEQRGVFTAVFHPHGWSGPEQWVDFIDYAQKQFGKRVKFLNFREAAERLSRNVLGGGVLFSGTQSSSDGARVLDLDGDGFQDVLREAQGCLQSRLWEPAKSGWGEWRDVPVSAGVGVLERTWIGVVKGEGATVFVRAPGSKSDATGGVEAATLEKGEWRLSPELCAGFPAETRLWMRDLDRDGSCELVCNAGLFQWDAKAGRWVPAGFSLPEGCAPFDGQGRDNGLRFVDLNHDGFEDVVQSNEAGYQIALWAGVVKENLGWKRGWPHRVASGTAQEGRSAKILPFVKGGRNNGVWIHGDAFVWQNEEVAIPGEESVRRTFRELIAFEMPEPRPAEASLRSMKLRPGFRAELVAAEPLVESPVAFEWDALGRLWVVEMADYPLGMDGKGKPGGRVKVLTSSKGDGRYDRATVFLEGLPFPTGVFPWRDGVLIACAPDILFAADRDGDGRADEKRVVFTGFREGNQQHRINGFEWGLDGWIYGANGDSGGEVNGVSIRGRDFRFRPDAGWFEAESGQTQHGRRRDDWGNWFGNNNSTWVWHYPVADWQLRRNPSLAVKTTRQVLTQGAEASRVFAVSQLPIRFNQPQSAGHVTSGCSPMPYRDSLFGSSFSESVFVCEPVHNAVHREVLHRVGGSFQSGRAEGEEQSEFLASEDPWFRPVYLKTGPDGALYIADFYRFVLEHPEWIAPETLSRLDVRAGADRGRIYRIVPEGVALRSVPALHPLDDAALGAAMDSENGWQRDTAHRLLMERGGLAAVQKLENIAQESPRAKARLQALCALETLSALKGEVLEKGLRDPDARVRAGAFRLVRAEGGRWFSRVVEGTRDSDAAVRFEAALALGAFRGEAASAALGALIERDAPDPWMRIAVLSSLDSKDPLFARLNEKPKEIQASAVVKVAASATGLVNRAAVVQRMIQESGMKGDAERGRAVFSRQCAVCHRLKGEGQEVGPDLGMVSDKPMDWLMTAIFDPNAAVEDRYRTHTVIRKGGGEVSGILSGETGNNVVLRMPGGVDVPVLRSEIVEQRSLKRSLMPEGLETVLRGQEVADLVEWIRVRR